MMAKLVTFVKERGAQRLLGEYSATDKNKVVANLFIRLGFAVTNCIGEFELELAHDFLHQTFVSSKTAD